MHRSTLSTICADICMQVKLAIMGKVRARAQKCRSIINYILTSHIGINYMVARYITE